MKKENVILEKSFQFALEIVQLYSKLVKQNEYVLSKQLLRSGTSIGANVEEAIAAASKKDFKHKMTIAFKEARETRYWLRLLEESQIVKLDFKAHIENSTEIIKILTAIVKTSSVN